MLPCITAHRLLDVATLLEILDLSYDVLHCGSSQRPSSKTLLFMQYNTSTPLELYVTLCVKHVLDNEHNNGAGVALRCSSHSPPRIFSRGFSLILF